MNQPSIAHIRGSWEYMTKYPNQMLVFYDKLFELAPETRRLFPDDISKQSEKLAYTIGFVVANLDRIDEIKGSIEDLGRIHNRLAIKPEYYEYVIAALIETIKDALNSEYSPEVGKSWEDALRYISDIMVNAPAKRENRFKSLLNKIFKN